MISDIIPQSRPTMGAEECKAVTEVLKSGQLAMGPMVSVFEQKFKDFMKTPHSLAVNSGTSALHLALLAGGVKPGDEVILPSYACTALLNAVQYTGARPVIADVSPASLCLSIDDVSKKVTSSTTAIVAVHTFGMAADITALSSFGIPVIEDCAHSIGGYIGNRRMGTVGDAAIFSFYPTKMIATAEGGMVTTSSSKIAEVVCDLRTYDITPEYRVRYNYKMNDISAALGIVQLSRLEGFIERRKSIAKRYDVFFRVYKEVALLERNYTSDVYYRYVVLMPNMALVQGFIDSMDKVGIVCDRPVAKPLHQYLNLSDADFPNTSEVFNRTVSIPLYPSLTDNEIERILHTCGRTLEEMRSLCESC